jgi:excisionase family DNA binding protein
MARDFYTPSEVAKILGVPLRRILERSAAGEIEAEKDPRTGRWRIPKKSLDGSETGRLSEGEAEWRQEKALLVAESHRERARADKELEKRANGEREKAARERERAEGLRGRLRDLKAEQSKGRRWKLFGG